MLQRKIQGIITQGYKVASGLSEQSPYPEGTIRMQMPFFEKLGLDLSAFFLGTLNFSIAPRRFKMINPRWTFPLVKWTALCPPETFSFSPCKVLFDNREYNALVYYPHPETKPAHFQNSSTLEILAPFINNLHYGEFIELHIDSDEIDVVEEGK